MENSPEIVSKYMNDELSAYIDILKNDKTNEKPALTENGKKVLQFLQDNQDTLLWKSKDLAERMDVSSRCVSGAMRKLVTDGFCERIGKDPIIYKLTEKGKNYIINNEE